MIQLGLEVKNLVSCFLKCLIDYSFLGVIMFLLKNVNQNLNQIPEKLSKSNLKNK